MTSNEVENARKVIQYWYETEFLSQADFSDNTDVRNSQKAVKNRKNSQTEKRRKRSESAPLLFYLKAGDHLEQKLIDQASSIEMKSWGHSAVYAGKVRKDPLISALLRMIPGSSAADISQEKSSHCIALFAFELNQRGEYVKGSFSLSPIVWAVNRIREIGYHPESISYSAYKEEQNRIENEYFTIKDGMEEVVPEAEDEEQDPPAIWENGPVFSEASVTFEAIRNLYEDLKGTYLDGLNQLETGEDDQRMVSPTILMKAVFYKDPLTKPVSSDLGYFGLNQYFYLSDLSAINSAVQKDPSQFSPAVIRIIRYVNSISDYSDKAGRINILDRNQIASLEKWYQDVLDPRNAPSGKWPSRLRLSLMQEAAVNLSIGKGHSLAFNQVKGIFSIDGPPGTGKTTLLKEIIAENTIRKAALLAGYQNPDEAFHFEPFNHGKVPTRFGINGYSRFEDPGFYRLVNPEISRCSMVLASSNNRAVENVTKDFSLSSDLERELKPQPNDTPEVSKKTESLLKKFSEGEADRELKFLKSDKTVESVRDVYFTRYADRLQCGKKAWGLIGAPLGKKENIKKFYTSVVNPFIWDSFRPKHPEEKSVRDFYLKSYQDAKAVFQKQYRKVLSMEEELASLNIFQETLQKNDQAAAAERAKLNQANLVLQDRISRSESEEKKLADAEAKNQEMVDSHWRILDEILKKNLSYEQQGDDLIARISQAKEELAREKNSYHVFDRFLHNEKYSSAQKREEDLNSRISSLDKEYADLQKKREQLSNLINQHNSEISSLNQALQESSDSRKEITNRRNKDIQELQENLQRIKQLQDAARFQKTLFQEKTSAFRKNHPDVTIPDHALISDLLDEDNEKSTAAHLASVGTNAAFDLERIELFYDALELIKYFLLSSKACRRNLVLLSEYWRLRGTSDAPSINFYPDDIKKFAGPVYETLFLMVPVVSTTLASFGMMFRDVNEESFIGTVVIDEAGQAVPRSALGAFRRAGKVLFLGDPNQIEPIVSEDEQLLRLAYQAPELKPYQNIRLSAQNFGDSLNPYGTYLNRGTPSERWIGCPLLVHRRCISPMFEISNSISYDGIMRQATAAHEDPKKMAFDSSRWIEVKGRETGNRNHYVSEQGSKELEIVRMEADRDHLDQLFIISPFATVVSGLKNDLKRMIKDHLMDGVSDDWIRNNIGTVHTFQGKQAEEVILLLGCDSSVPSSISWVDSNIVNTAVTRAKYRLYVIGEAAPWVENNSFIRVVKDMLDQHCHSAKQKSPSETAEKHQLVEEETASEDEKNPTAALCNQISDTDSGISHADLMEELIPDASKNFTSEEAAEKAEEADSGKPIKADHPQEEGVKPKGPEASTSLPAAEVKEEITEKDLLEELVQESETSDASKMEEAKTASGSEENDISDADLESELVSVSEEDSSASSASDAGKEADPEEAEKSSEITASDLLGELMAVDDAEEKNSSIHGAENKTIEKQSPGGLTAEQKKPASAVLSDAIDSDSWSRKPKTKAAYQKEPEETSGSASSETEQKKFSSAKQSDADSESLSEDDLQSELIEEETDTAEAEHSESPAAISSKLPDSMTAISLARSAEPHADTTQAEESWSRRRHTYAFFAGEKNPDHQVPKDMHDPHVLQTETNEESSAQSDVPAAETLSEQELQSELIYAEPESSESSFSNAQPCDTEKAADRPLPEENKPEQPARMSSEEAWSKKKHTRAFFEGEATVQTSSATDAARAEPSAEKHPDASMTQSAKARNPDLSDEDFQHELILENAGLSEPADSESTVKKAENQPVGVPSSAEKTKDEPAVKAENPRDYQRVKSTKAFIPEEGMIAKASDDETHLIHWDDHASTVCPEKNTVNSSETHSMEELTHERIAKPLERPSEQETENAESKTAPGVQNEDWIRRSRTYASFEEDLPAKHQKKEEPSDTASPSKPAAESEALSEADLLQELISDQNVQTAKETLNSSPSAVFDKGVENHGAVTGQSDPLTDAGSKLSSSNAQTNAPGNNARPKKWRGAAYLERPFYPQEDTVETKSDASCNSYTEKALLQIALFERGKKRHQRQTLKLSPKDIMEELYLDSDAMLRADGWLDGSEDDSGRPASSSDDLNNDGSSEITDEQKAEGIHAGDQLDDQRAEAALLQPDKTQKSESIPEASEKPADLVANDGGSDAPQQNNDADWWTSLQKSLFSVLEENVAVHAEKGSPWPTEEEIKEGKTINLHRAPVPKPKNPYKVKMPQRENIPFLLLCILIDHSSSMNSQNRIDMLNRCIRNFLDQVKGNRRANARTEICIIGYGSAKPVLFTDFAKPSAIRMPSIPLSEGSCLKEALLLAEQKAEEAKISLKSIGILNPRGGIIVITDKPTCSEDDELDALFSRFRNFPVAQAIGIGTGKDADFSGIKGLIPEEQVFTAMKDVDLEYLFQELAQSIFRLFPCLIVQNLSRRTADG